jgi:chemotaxis protein MotB
MIDHRVPQPPSGESEQTQTATTWLVTFTDLVSLMLTFFVMLFAMSNVKVDQWEQIIDTLSRTLDPAPEEEVAKQKVEFNIGAIFRKRAIDLDYLEGVLVETIEQEPLLEDVRISLLEDRLVMALPGDLLFRPGEAEISEDAREAVFVLGGVFRNIGNAIQVNGHTDPAPPDPARGYDSNWELSMARATAVANAFRRVGYEDAITAFGYADSRFESLPDVDPAERRRLARRVDVIVTPEVAGR